MFLITKDNLAVAKFAVDLARDPSDEDAVKIYGYAVYLPYVFALSIVTNFMILFLRGTLTSSTTALNRARARDIKNAILRSSSFETSQPSHGKSHTVGHEVYKQNIQSKIWEQEIKEAVKFSMTNLRTLLSEQLRAPMWVNFLAL
jgi:hypothetical protein